MTLLVKSTHTYSQTLVKDTVKPYLHPNVLEHPSELFVAFSKFHLNTSNLLI
jgi:hypothetical protein